MSFRPAWLSAARNLGIIAILVIFGLPEVPALRTKIRSVLTAADQQELIDTVDEIARKNRRYLGVTALTSLITGVGILNFLLNFIPISLPCRS